MAKLPESVSKTGALAAYVAANKRKTRLVGHIEQHLLKLPPSDRPTNILHPSELSHSDWCILDAYHRLLDPAPQKENPGMRLANIFAEGHAIHDKWQSWIWDMGKLYGKWKCRYCDHDWWDTSPVKCPWCGQNLIKYAEVPLISDPKYRMAGHADGWVTGINDPFLIEIKSIGTGTIRMENLKLLEDNDNDLEKAWKQIRRPFPSHLRQGQIYLTLLHQMHQRGEIDGPIPEEIVYIYELKSNQDYKEFPVKWDYEIVKDIFELAADIDWAIQTGQPPTCNIGPTCKKCSQYAKGE